MESMRRENFMSSRTKLSLLNSLFNSLRFLHSQQSNKNEDKKGDFMTYPGSFDCQRENGFHSCHFLHINQEENREGYSLIFKNEL